jgi:hypothetical protein
VAAGPLPRFLCAAQGAALCQQALGAWLDGCSVVTWDGRRDGARGKRVGVWRAGTRGVKAAARGTRVDGSREVLRCSRLSCEVPGTSGIDDRCLKGGSGAWSRKPMR